MKTSIYSKILAIVLFGFIGAPFMLLGLIAGAVWIALLSGWLWADSIAQANAPKETK